MKYGIKLRGTIGTGGQFLQARGHSSISEYTGANSAKIIEFDDIGEANVYAENHEIKNYTVEPVYDFSSGMQTNRDHGSKTEAFYDEANTGPYPGWENK